MDGEGRKRGARWRERVREGGWREAGTEREGETAREREREREHPHTNKPTHLRSTKALKTVGDVHVREEATGSIALSLQLVLYTQTHTHTHTRIH
jgi:hypothetical protein